jgi:hypothetical protein
LNGSNHHPLFIDVERLNTLQPLSRETVNASNRKSIAWGRITDEHIALYKVSLNASLQRIPLPACLNECYGMICSDAGHKRDIDTFCNALCAACIDSGMSTLPLNRPNTFSRPKWKELVKPFKDDALFWDAIWKECGRPGDGHVHGIRQRTKREYHYAVRRYKKQENALRRQRMAEELAHNNTRQFWNEVNRVRPKKAPTAPVVDGASNEASISEVFVQKYEELFNSVPSDDEHLRSVIEANEMSSDFTGGPGVIVTLEELNSAVKKLNERKSDGDLGLWSNYILWMPPEARDMLSLLLSAMLSHGHTPSIINIGTITSIPKDPSGDICSSENYRGIALSSPISKLMELILIAKSGNAIASSPLQFAYKANHGTSMCTLMLKETANYFMNRKSGVYCALVDASKAFDRLRHDKLFDILLKRRVPPIIIRYLVDNYRRQEMQVKWGSMISRKFGVQNGVKQGGILSPILFNVYMDILLERLKDSGIGCHVDGVYVGALAYADDLTLLCPSLQGLQSMLKVCEEFSREFSVRFNPTKTQCIHFCRAQDPGSFEIYLDGKSLKWVSEVKHLGHFVTYNLNEERETRAKIGDYISSVNTLRANFKGVNANVLIRLFKTYCTVFYGSQSWDLTSSHVHNVCTKFNRGVRLLLNLPFRTHCNILPVLLECTPLNLQFAQRFVTMHKKMLASTNPVIRNFAASVQNDQRSIIAKNVNHFHQLQESIIPPSDELLTTCSAIKEILHVINPYSNHFVNNFTNDDLDTILVQLCTN